MSALNIIFEKRKCAYEYCEVDVQDESIIASCNRLGADGWILASMKARKDTNGMTLYFCRQKISVNPDKTKIVK